MALFCIRVFLISTDGSLHNLVHTAVSQHMLLSFWEPSGLLHGKEFGRAGLLGAANFQLVSHQQLLLFSQLSCQARVVSSVCLPFCDQAVETIQHILISCVFGRQVWTLIFQKLSLSAVAPLIKATHFSSWWVSTIRNVPKEIRKGLNSLIILVAFEVWKHWNACVLEGVLPNIQVLLQTLVDGWGLCSMARASNLHFLRLPAPDFYLLGGWLVFLLVMAVCVVCA